MDDEKKLEIEVTKAPCRIKVPIDQEGVLLPGERKEYYKVIDDETESCKSEPSSSSSSIAVGKKRKSYFSDGDESGNNEVFLSRYAKPNLVRMAASSSSTAPPVQAAAGGSIRDENNQGVECQEAVVNPPREGENDEVPTQEIADQEVENAPQASRPPSPGSQASSNSSSSVYSEYTLASSSSASPVASQQEMSDLDQVSPQGTQVRVPSIQENSNPSGQLGSAAVGPVIPPVSQVVVPASVVGAVALPVYPVPVASTAGIRPRVVSLSGLGVSVMPPRIPVMPPRIPVMPPRIPVMPPPVVPVRASEPQNQQRQVLLATIGQQQRQQDEQQSPPPPGMDQGQLLQLLQQDEFLVAEFRSAHFPPSNDDLNLRNPTKLQWFFGKCVRSACRGIEFGTPMECYLHNRTAGHVFLINGLPAKWTVSIPSGIKQFSECIQTSAVASIETQFQDFAVRLLVIVQVVKDFEGQCKVKIFAVNFGQLVVGSSRLNIHLTVRAENSHRLLAASYAYDPPRKTLFMNPRQYDLRDSDLDFVFPLGVCQRRPHSSGQLCYTFDIYVQPYASAL